jgi:hypothetical protein
MNHSASPEWEREQKCLDLIAMLLKAQQHAATIRLQAWNEGDWLTVFKQSVALEKCLGELLLEAQSYWPALYAAARGDTAAG